MCPEDMLWNLWLLTLFFFLIAYARQLLKMLRNSSKLTNCVDTHKRLMDELVCIGIYSKAHETDPVKAISDLIRWNVEVALDPKVSVDAVKLQNEAYRKAADLCLHKDYGFDIDEWTGATKRGISMMMARRLGEEIEKQIVPLDADRQVSE